MKARRRLCQVWLINYFGLVFAGLVIAGLALSLATLAPPTPRALAGALLVAGFEIGTAAAGLISCDARCPAQGQSLQGVLHKLIAITGSLSAFAPGLSLPHRSEKGIRVIRGRPFHEERVIEEVGTIRIGEGRSLAGANRDEADVPIEHRRGGGDHLGVGVSARPLGSHASLPSRHYHGHTGHLVLGLLPGELKHVPSRPVAPRDSRRLRDAFPPLRFPARLRRRP